MLAVIAETSEETTVRRIHNNRTGSEQRHEVQAGKRSGKRPYCKLIVRKTV